MEPKLFDLLCESVQQMDEIVDGKREAQRTNVIASVQVKAIRERTQLTQQKFAQLIDVSVGTLHS